ncbi:MAG: response regulator [Candidatus Rokubacteria bacterium]|nr:response regulator [Candidatus Rokubacteria bacterium]
MADAAERCARIVRNFLALARQRPPERGRVALDQVVHEAVELLAYPLRVDSVEVALELARNLPALWADAHQLHQVVVNLVSNAHHAVREATSPRRITLTTRQEAGGGSVVLEVADSGRGIPREIQARLFEPFFTTKPPGQGTGLGLALCKGIVEAHGGSIEAASPPGSGAVFRVELPVENAPVAAAAARAAAASPPVRGQRILVVDDEAEIAALLSEMLAADGHRVEIAANGVEALEKLGAGGHDLVISDLRMPELDGPGLYLEVTRRHPALLRRMVFVTGDTLGPESLEFLHRTNVPTLGKPFDLDDIRRVVQQVLV